MCYFIPFPVGSGLIFFHFTGHVISEKCIFKLIFYYINAIFVKVFNPYIGSMNKKSLKTNSNFPTH